MDELVATSLLVERFGGLRELTSMSVPPQRLQSFLDALAPLLHPPSGMTMEDVMHEVGTEGPMMERFDSCVV